MAALPFAGFATSRALLDHSLARGPTLSCKISSLRFPSTALDVNTNASGGAARIGVPRASVATGDASADASALNQAFGGQGVSVESGEGGLPKVVLKGSDGSEADVYLYGACTTSWRLPSGEDVLFVRPDAVFTGKKPISGGIPHCFPQFGPGAIQQHGFARNLSWAVAATTPGSSPSVTLKLEANDYSRAMWDFAFEALFEVSLSPGGLVTEFRVTNTDNKPFSFTTALHTYFRAAISGVRVQGLKGKQFLNKDPDPQNPIPGTESREEITFPGFVDCMYMDAPATLVLDNGLGQTVSISNENWSDAVLWNPHLTMEACFKDFVCVENAQLKEVQLGPGESWTAKQSLEAK